MLSIPKIHLLHFATAPFMESVRKIRIVIEAELRERVPTMPSSSATDLDPLEYSYEQALFSALRADPERYAAFIKIRAITSLEILGLHNEISKLAQIRDSYTASIKTLESLLPSLPQPAQQYLQEALTKGWIMDDADSIYNTMQIEPLSLAIEYPTDRS